MSKTVRIYDPATGKIGFMCVTIYDQFGKVLDAIYNGTGDVSETWTNVTVRGGGALDNGPIMLPTGTLTSGVILDATGFQIPDQLTQTLSAQQLQAWVAFKLLLNNVANNLFANVALPASPPYAQGTQNLTVHGFSVTPNYVRTQEGLVQNYPPSPYSITNTPQ